MTVQSICRSDYPVIQADATIREAASKMQSHGARWLTVTADASIVGLVSDRDILRGSVIEGLDQDHTPVESIMKVGLPVCSPDATLEDAAEIMSRKHICQVAVVSDDGPRAVIGIVKAEDVLRAIEPGVSKLDFLLSVLS